MQNYELMLVVQGQIPEDLAKEVISKVKSLLSELGAKEETEDFWGRRKLAYKISGQEHGYYDVLNFQMEGENIKKLENEIKLIGEIIRFLVVKKLEKAVEKPKEKKVVKKEGVVKAEEDLKEVGLRPITRRVKKQEKETPYMADQLKAEKKEEPVTIGGVEKQEEKVEEAKEQKFEGEKERLKELDKKIDEILKE